MVLNVPKTVTVFDLGVKKNNIILRLNIMNWLRQWHCAWTGIRTVGSDKKGDGVSYYRGLKSVIWWRLKMLKVQIILLVAKIIQHH